MKLIQKFLLAGLTCLLCLTACKKEELLQTTELNQALPSTQKSATSRNAETECFILKFPITMILFDGTREKIYSLDEYFEIMEWWMENEADETEPRIKFPIRATLANGKVTRIRNQNALENLIASCEESNTEEEEIPVDTEEETEGEETPTDTEETEEETGGEEENGNNNGEEGNEGTEEGNNDGEDDGNEGNTDGGATNPSTTAWFTAIGGSKEESHGHYIIQCNDGGYLQVGETGFIPNSARLLVVKTNSTGQLVWKKEFGNTGHNLGNSALEIADGYLIAGALSQNSTLLKLNKSTGAVIFEKTYNTGGNDAFEQVALTSNGIAAVGYRNALDGNNTFYTEGEGYMVFLDNNGNKIADKDLRSYTTHAYRVKRYNNELIISGLSYGAEDYEVIKTDLTGNVLWKKSYGGSNADHGFGLDLGPDGSIFLTGHTLSGTQNWDTYTMKLDNSGGLLWEQKRGNPRGFDPRYIHDEAWDIRATNDGGCIVVAGTGDEYEQYSSCQNGSCSDNWQVYVIKYDASGNVAWQNTYAGEGDWAGEAIDLTADGGVIIGVDNGQFGFLKLGSF